MNRGAPRPAGQPAPAVRPLALVLAAAFALPATGVAAADPVAACTPSHGVIVVVDFSHWGGDVQRGCDANPSTGYDALHVAGFTTAGTVHDGPAFVCRIDDYPTPDQESCNRTPPASAYWSYWHADPGQDSWSYSSQGAMSYHPAPGSVDAWEFGDGSNPPFSPAQVRALQPPASTPPRSSSASRTSMLRPGGPGIAGSPAVTTPAHRSSTTTAAGPASRPSAASATRAGLTSPGLAAAAPTSSGPRIIDAVPALAYRAPARHSLAAALLSVAVVLLLAGAAGWRAWQRRRARRLAAS